MCGIKSYTRDITINGRPRIAIPANGQPDVMSVSFTTRDTIEVVDTILLTGEDRYQLDTITFVARLVKAPAPDPKVVAPIAQGYPIVGEHIVTVPFSEGVHTFSFIPEKMSSYGNTPIASKGKSEPLYLYIGVAFLPLVLKKNPELTNTWWKTSAEAFVAPRPAGSLLNPMEFLGWSLGGIMALLVPNSQGKVDALIQDEVDTLRQEYVDWGLNTFPTREEVVPVPAEFNTTSYSVAVDGGMVAKRDELVGKFKGHRVLAVGSAGMAPVPMVAAGEDVFVSPTASVHIVNGYRNPAYNKAIGSEEPNSKHVYGKALDLTPQTVVGTTASGKTVPLDLHKHVYPTLVAVGLEVCPKSIAEHGPVQVQPGDAAEDHVHVQW